MTRSAINHLVTYKTLEFIDTVRNANLTDSIIDGHIKAGDSTVEAFTKNVCAKVPAHLSDEIDEVVNLLGISKRRFLEAAFSDAVVTARQIMRDEGVHEVLRDVDQVRQAEKEA